MKNKNEIKKNEEKKASLDQPWNRIPAWSGLELEDELTAVPKGTVGRHIALAIHLEAQQPKVLINDEPVRLARMVQARRVADAALDHERRSSDVPVKAPWGEVVSLMATVTGTLAMSQKARVPELSASAIAAGKAVFTEGVVVGKLTPREGWTQVNKVRARLESAPVYEALTHFVPPGQLTALFAANDRLGQALGMTERTPEVTVVVLSRVHEYLRREITGYVRCIAASADVLDAASVQRAKTALKPIADHRATNARRAAKASAAVTTTGDDGEPLESPATTSVGTEAPAAPGTKPDAADAAGKAEGDTKPAAGDTA